MMARLTSKAGMSQSIAGMIWRTAGHKHMRSSLLRSVVSTSQNATDAGMRSTTCHFLQVVGRRNSTPPPPRPRGGLSVLSGRGASDRAQVLSHHTHALVTEEVDRARVKAFLLLGPGIG